MSAVPSLLELNQVSAGYGEKVVLRGISFDLEAGGSIAILGPNGAGKTTLLKTCSGLLRPTGGRIHLAGRDVTRLPAHERVARGLCHIPDPRGIFPRLTVKENLLLQARRGGASTAIEAAATAFPRLGQRLHQVAGSLSGGEQQMLALARSYIQSPRLVLLDELSMGLAPILVDEIYAFLADLKQQGVALVIVEQFVHRALALTDQVVVIARGRIAATGKSEAFDEDRIFEAYTGAPSREDTVHA